MKKIVLIVLLCNTYLKTISQTVDFRDIGTLAVLIQTELGSGSGFYLKDTVKNYVCLVTACHVIVNKQNKVLSDSILFISYKKNSQRDDRDSFKLSLSSAAQMGMFSYDIQKDVAVIKFAITKGVLVSYLPFIRKTTKTTTHLNPFQVNQIKKINNITTMSDIFTVGYPKSLSLQANFDYNRPLIRRGIISGIDLNKKKIIADCAVYQGNSGGAVFEIQLLSNELYLVGIVSKFVMFEEHWKNEAYNYTNTNVYNSGYAVLVPMDEVLDLIKNLKN